MGIAPSIAECDGDYHHDSRKNVLQWNLPVIDAASKQGSMEFSVPSSIPGDFFPLDVSLQICLVSTKNVLNLPFPQVSFSSKVPYAELTPLKVQMVEDGTDAKYSAETLFYTDKYEIV